MKILQLVPRFPFPEDDGGKIGIANIYKEFSRQGYNITLFSLNHLNIDANDLKEAEKFGKVIIVNTNTKNDFRNIFKSILTNSSVYIQKHNQKEVYDAIDNLINNLNDEEKFDIVHSDHTCMTPLALYVGKKLSIPVGQRLHNIEYKIWERYADGIPKYNPKYFYLKHQAYLLMEEESKIFNQIDIGFVITNNDKQIAKTISPNSNLILASAGADLDLFKPIEGEENSKTKNNPYELIIATTFNWVHNIEGVLWFIKNVLPIIKREIPEVYLTIIGKNPPKGFDNFSNQGVKSLGYVDSVIPYLQQASIYVAPLFVGSGIRIKILEALAVGLPVVATKVSAEGIELGDEEGLIVSDKAEDQANQIINLINNPEKIKLLGVKARESIKENYTWKKNVMKMVNGYNEIIKKYMDS